MATDSSVSVTRREGTAQGQAQGNPFPAPHDGRHWTDETYVVTDKVIIDVNDPLAVQVPDGVGASTAGHASPMSEIFARGTAEDQFAKANASDESASESTDSQVKPEDTASGSEPEAQVPADTEPEADTKS